MLKYSYRRDDELVGVVFSNKHGDHTEYCEKSTLIDCEKIGIYNKDKCITLKTQHTSDDKVYHDCGIILTPELRFKIRALNGERDRKKREAQKEKA